MKLVFFGLAVMAASLCVMAQDSITLPAGAELVLRQTYKAGFSCEGRKYGYYADVNNDCQVFHVCVPVADEQGLVTDTITYSFYCGNQTTFNQEFMTCDNPGNVDCGVAESLYSVNDYFGVIPEKD